MASKLKVKEPSKLVSYITNAVLCVTLIGCIVAGLRFFQPDTFYSIALSFELKSSPVDIASERQRINRINTLPLNDEKKKILINHTIFMQASTSMVKLALGEPRYMEPSSKNAEGVTVDRWVYHFQDDLRPTVLQFEDDKLAAAYKVSEHRLTGYPSPEAAQAPAPAAATTPSAATPASPPTSPTATPAN